jgi:PAS domain S-box-containing protein
MNSRGVVRRDGQELQNLMPVERSGAPATRLEPQRLLLVEDEQDVAELICRLLAAIPDVCFDVVLVSRLSEALARLADGGIDLVLMDLGLPDSRGVAGLTQVRQKAPTVPVLVLSGLEDKDVERRCLEQGAQDYLVKGYVLSSDLLAHFLRLASARQQLLVKVEQVGLALQASEARFRQMINENIDGIVVVGRDGRALFANPAAQELFGCTADELLGTQIGVPRVAGERCEIDLPCRKDDPPRVAEMRAIEILWEGRLAHLATIRDVTERKQAEQAAQELAQMKDDFVANVSHQLRTPLHALKGFLDLLCRGQVTDRSVQHEFLTRAAEATERLILLANRLLQVFQLGSGRMTLEMQEVDLRALIATTVESLRGLAAKKGIPITQAVPDTDVFLSGDGYWLGEALSNLIDNAIKFSEPGRPIQVSVEVGNGLVTIKVIDQGPGIAAEDQPRLFGKFYQAEGAAKRAGRGSGLGLSIAKGIIDAHRGQIGVLSEPGKGSTFFFTLPVLDKCATPNQAACVATDAPGAAQRGEGRDAGRKLWS